MDKIALLSEEIERLGGRSAFAAALGVSPQVVWNWLHRDKRVPAHNCPDVERITGGVIVCEDFWPDTDWAYIRASAPSVANNTPNPSHPNRRPTDPAKIMTATVDQPALVRKTAT